MKIENLRVVKLSKEDFEGTFNVFRATIPVAFKSSEGDSDEAVVESEINL